MFGQAGHAYVYMVYGMHCCLNVVGNTPGRAGAVLLRAIEPRIGAELMRDRRGVTAALGPEWRLAAGPARLCQALGVTRRLDGHDLTRGRQLWLAAPPAGAPPPVVLEGPRIGVPYAGEWADRPWRFGVAGSASLSRPFPGSSDAGGAR
jgi:DNA-3-methyladenine glycosylase